MYSSVSSFCLTLCVYFFVFSSSATSPSLEGMFLCRRCPVGPRNIILPHHQSQVLHRYPLCGLSMPSCCSGAITTASALVGGLASDPAGQPQGLAATAVGVLVQRAGPWLGCLWGLSMTVLGMMVGRDIVLSAGRSRWDTELHGSLSRTCPLTLAV